jgi:hypothetical protein
LVDTVDDLIDSTWLTTTTGATTTQLELGTTGGTVSPSTSAPMADEGKCRKSMILKIFKAPYVFLELEFLNINETHFWASAPRPMPPATVFRHPASQSGTVAFRLRAGVTLFR